MTLTEQWKKGELKQGEYWCKITESPYIERVYLPCCDDIIVEVLAPVPTYQEYLESEAHCVVYSEVNKRLEEENKQLRALLKECKDIVSIEKDFASCHFEKDKLCKLLTKINSIIGESEE